MIDPNQRPFDHQIDGEPGEVRPYNQNIDGGLAEEPPLVVAAEAGKRRQGRGVLKSASIGVLAAVVLNPFFQTAKEGIKMATADPCEAPTVDEVRRVQTMLAAPRVPGSPTQIAGKLGLTLYRKQDKSVVQDIQAMPLNSVENFRTIVARANGFTRRYGIKVEVADGDYHGWSSLDYKKPKAANLRDESSRSAVLDIVKGLSAFPVEYVRYSGATKIVLGSRFSHNAAGFVDTAHDKKTIHYNLGASIEDTLAHELYHMIDGRECGAYSMDKDPEFEKLNGEDIYQSGNDVNASLEYNDDHEKKLDDAIEAAYYDGKRREFCTLYSRRLKLLARAKVLTKYSLKNVVEDKAEQGAELRHVDKKVTALDKDTPIVRRKFEFLLARLYHHQPVLARYFAAVAKRPSPQEDIGC